MTNEELCAELRNAGWDIYADRIEQLERERDEWKGAAQSGYDANMAIREWAQNAEAALIQSRAETAAAYELAADRADNDAQMYWENGAVSASAALVNVAAAIRALATPEQSAALDAVKAEAWAQGMREAAEIAISLKKPTKITAAYERAGTCEDVAEAILAAIQKGEPK